MRILFYTASIISIIGFGTIASAQEDTSKLAQRLELAKQYSAAVPVEESINESIENIIVQMPKEDRVVFKSILNRTIKSDQIQAVSEMALADIFTKAELEAMVEFYSSDEGRSVRRKMGDYMGRVQPVIQQMMRDASEIYVKQKQ